MITKRATDKFSKRDSLTNRKGEEYNRAVVTVKQNEKEKELMQAGMSNIMMQMQVMQQKQELLDLAAKIDLQQKLLDNKITATQQMQPLPQELPQMPGLPSMPPGAMPPPEMMGMPPEAMGPQGMPIGAPIGDMGLPPGMPMPPPAPYGDSVMPPMM